MNSVSYFRCEGRGSDNDQGWRGSKLELENKIIKTRRFYRNESETGEFRIEPKYATFDVTDANGEDEQIEIETSIRDQHSEVTALFIKPQTPKAYSEASRDRFGIEGDG